MRVLKDKRDFVSLKKISMVGNLSRKCDSGIGNADLLGDIRPNRNISTNKLKPDGFKQLNLGLTRNAIKCDKTINIARVKRKLEGQTTLIHKHKHMEATSNPLYASETTKGAKFVKNPSEKEASIVEKGLEVNTPRILKVYERKRKWSNASRIATIDSIVEPIKDEGLIDARIIKHYVRRRHCQPRAINVATIPSQPIPISPNNERKDNNNGGNLEDMSNWVEKEESLHVLQHQLKDKNKKPLVEHPSNIHSKVECECNINVFQHCCTIHSMPMVEHVDDPPRVAKERNLNVFQCHSKKNLPYDAKHLSHVSTKDETICNGNVFKHQTKMNPPPNMTSRNNIVKVVNATQLPTSYTRADYQPNWLPNGWTLEIHHRDFKTHTRDKHYRDKTSGHVFRSKYEVLQFLNGGGMVGLEVPQYNKKKLPVQISKTKHTDFQSTLSKPSQFKLVSPTTSSSPITNMHHVRTKTTPMRLTYGLSNEAKAIDPTWDHAKISNGARGTHTSIQSKEDRTSKDGGVLHQCKLVPNNSKLLNFRDGIQLSMKNSKFILKSPSIQEDKENKEKLVLKLKRKHEDLGGNGKLKQPMYEIVHVEKASSSTSTGTSTPTKKKKKVLKSENGIQQAFQERLWRSTLKPTKESHHPSPPSKI